MTLAIRRCCSRCSPDVRYIAILLNVAGCVDIISNDFGWGDEVFLSFLPLSHAYEHSGGQFLPIGLGGQIYYAEGLEKLAGNIEEVRPTIMVVVPRLFEVLRARMLKLSLIHIFLLLCAIPDSVLADGGAVSAADPRACLLYTSRCV